MSISNPFSIVPQKWHDIHNRSLAGCQVLAADIRSQGYGHARFVPYWDDFAVRSANEVVENRLAEHGGFVAEVTHTVYTGNRGVHLQQNGSQPDDKKYIVRATKIAETTWWVAEHATPANALRSRNGKTPRGRISLLVVRLREGYLLVWPDGEQVSEIIDDIRLSNAWKF